MIWLDDDDVDDDDGDADYDDDDDDDNDDDDDDDDDDGGDESISSISFVADSCRQDAWTRNKMKQHKLLCETQRQKSTSKCE